MGKLSRPVTAAGTGHEAAGPRQSAPFPGYEPSERLKALRRRLKVIVLDCDGVLFDSKAANIRFYDHVLGHFGLPGVAPDQEEFVHMHSARESLELLFRSAPEHLEAAWNYCRQMDFSEFNQYLAVEPGLTEFLERCRRSYAVALATNRTVSTRGVLEHFGLLGYFDVVVTAADVARPKPMPDMMEMILKRFSVQADQVLFIGDSRVDADFAGATGVHFAAYKNPAVTAALHIDHFDRLRALFDLPAGNGSCRHADHRVRH